MPRLKAQISPLLAAALLILCSSAAVTPCDAQMRAAGLDTTFSQRGRTPSDSIAAPERVTPPAPYEQVYELDRIAAVVNDHVILESEVQDQTFFFASQQGISLADSASLASARKEVLERLIEEKVIIDKARERGMTVSDADIERAVDGVVQDMIRGTGSEQAFRAQLEREGLTEEDLRELYRPRLEAQILASRLVRREVSTEAEVTEAEIEEYYNENKDSFPQRPETVRLSHIYISLMPDSAAYAQARGAAERVRERVLAGEDFAEIARELSADPSARKGGDLGYFKRGQLAPQFEEAVFSLEPGEVSEVVQTRFGFHVIKLTDMRGDEARASHILIPVVPTAEAVVRAQAKMESIKVALDAGVDFSELAASHSEDPDTRDSGGDLGYFAVNELTPDVKGVIKDLEPGEISEVTAASDGFHIFLLTEYRPEGRFTLEETRDDIREMMRREKLERSYQEWIKGLKEDAYVSVKRG